jgi:accessory colonization factor AcfC
LIVAAGNLRNVRRLDDIVREDIRIVMASASEPGARNQYISALEAMLGEQRVQGVLARETISFPGRLGIQHRDVPHAIANCDADAGIIFHHLAQYYAAAYPSVCSMVAVPQAEQYSSTIAMAQTLNPLRAPAARAFSEFFLGSAREVYPRYGFATMGPQEFGQVVALD